jgi:uncharacterized membrane protein YdjX (TVP38/TMEM64 family)
MSSALQNSATRPLRQLRRVLRPKLLVGAIAIVAIVIAAKLFGSDAILKEALGWVTPLGPLAPIAFVGAYIMAAVLFIPGAILTIGAGIVFGLLRGIIYVSVGATLGAASAFLIGRYLARDWAARKLGANPKFKAIDQAVAQEGWKIVVLARLSPIFPFNLLNYAFGLTDIPFKDYFLASWAGMLPGIAMYVYIGTLAGDLAGIANGRARANSANWAFEIAGFVATVAVVVYVAHVARKALRQKNSS